MKKTISTIIASLFIASIIVPQTSVTVKAAEKTAETSNKRVVTYFPSWGIYQAGQKYTQVKDIAWDKVTHVNHGFFEINNSYQIQTTDSYADFDNEGFPHAPKADWDKYPTTGYPKDTVFGHFGEYKYYKSKYPNVKLLISVGGWTRSDKFHEVSASAEKRKILANSMVDFMKKYPFVDGMDIDWEYPTVTRAPEDQYDRGCVGGPEDKENFTLLLKDIRETFNANGMKDKLLTVAVSAGEAKIKNTEPDKYSQYVDYIGVMTYDFAGAWDTTTGHLAGIYANPNDPVKERAKFNANDAMNIFANDYKVPKDKLLAGTPLYSRGWGNVAPGPNGDGLFQNGDGKFKGNLGEGGQYSWFDLKNLEKAPGWTKYRDPIAKVPYLYNSSTKQFITYEDETSLQERINFVNNNNYGGLIVWDASGDDFDGARTMHNILYNGLVKNSPVVNPENAAPTISGATNLEIKKGTSFDAKTGVTAYDKEDGDLTSKIIISGNVDVNKAGKYQVTYSVSDSKNVPTTVTRIVTVIDDSVKPTNTAPVISGVADKTINVSDSFNALANVKATDKEDGDLTSAIKVSGSVDTSKAGSYTLVYTVTDKDGATTTAKAVITVKSVPVVGNDTYDSNKVYNAGDTVVYGGVTYKAGWWTKGETPGKSGVWEVVVTTNPDGSLPYVAGKSYSGGDKVSYNGKTYKANWWTNSVPGTDSSWSLL